MTSISTCGGCKKTRKRLSHHVGQRWAGALPLRTRPLRQALQFPLEEQTLTAIRVGRCIVRDANGRARASTLGLDVRRDAGLDLCP